MKTESITADPATSCHPAQCVIAIATSAGGLNALSVILGDGRREVRRQAAQDDGKGVEPTGRGCNGDDALGWMAGGRRLGGDGFGFHDFEQIALGSGGASTS